MSNMDAIVGGRNFGCGSSRKQAATCLVYNGVGAVIAAIFSRIFYRNALNNGLLAIVCPEAAGAIRPGDAVSVDPDRHTITCPAGTFSFPPLSPSVMGIVRAGGLVAYVKRNIEYRVSVFDRAADRFLDTTKYSIHDTRLNQWRLHDEPTGSHIPHCPDPRRWDWPRGGPRRLPGVDWRRASLSTSWTWTLAGPPFNKLAPPCPRRL